MSEATKPRWLRRLHVAAHQGRPAVGCTLCTLALADLAGNPDLLVCRQTDACMCEACR